MKQEGSTGGFEQASADAEKLAAELAEIRKELTALREQNAKFLATDPVSGAAPAPAPEVTASAAPKKKKKGGVTAESDAPGTAVSSRLKEPEMAGVPKPAARGASSSTTEQPEPAAEPASEGDQSEQGKRKWWRKTKTSDPKEIGF